MRVLTSLALYIALASPLALAGPQNAACNPAGNVQFVCGQQAPEDLVLVPGSEWVLAGAFSGSGFRNDGTPGVTVLAGFRKSPRVNR